jgi:uncharacterized membrane protein YuzA (DUF378 family)
MNSPSHDKRSATWVGQVALWLSVIGALNWGLVGVADFDLVRAILGGETSTPASGLSRAIYAVVGIAGLALAAVGPRLRARSHAERVARAA